MWISSFKSKARSLNLGLAVEQVEAVGLLQELQSLLTRVRSTVQGLGFKEMVSISKLLVEEVWNEGKKFEDLSTSKVTLQNSTINKSQSGTMRNSIIRKIEFPVPSTPSRYKLQVSQDLAYMVISIQSSFSFPKGCGTFYKSRKNPLDKIGESPGPGSYFCDPRSLHHSRSSQLSNSARKLSISLIKY
jgi:hypothetical protein